MQRMNFQKQQKPQERNSYNLTGNTLTLSGFPSSLDFLNGAYAK
jgi:hypothetical protein